MSDRVKNYYLNLYVTRRKAVNLMKHQCRVLRAECSTDWVCKLKNSEDLLNFNTFLIFKLNFEHSLPL